MLKKFQTYRLKNVGGIRMGKTEFNRNRKDESPITPDESFPGAGIAL
jgi:hypothetical protein